MGPGVRAGVSRATPAASERGSESSRPPSREGVKEKTVKLKRAAWDTKGRLEDMELAYQELKQRLEGTTNEKENVNDLLASERARCIVSLPSLANDSVGAGNHPGEITVGERSTPK